MNNRLKGGPGMDDRRIETLLRMAGEVDELERSGSAPALRLVAGAGGSGAPGGMKIVIGAWSRRFGVLAAAAAVLAATGWSYFALNPVRHRSPTGIAVVPPSRAAPLPTLPGAIPAVEAHGAPLPLPAHVLSVASAQASMLLGIFQDAAGEVRCVQWRERDGAPRPAGSGAAEDFRRGELLGMMHGQPCAAGPYTMIAVGLSGPRGKLPDSEECAHAFAQCLLHGPSTGAEHAPIFLTEGDDAGGCLPAGLTVKMETVAFGKP